MERSRWFSTFSGEHLTNTTIFDYHDVVMKKRGSIISYFDNILGGGHTREVVVIGSGMEIIDDVFSLIMSKTKTKNGVNNALV